MADLTTQVISIAGTAPTFAAAAGGGDTAAANGKTLLIVKNGDASSKDVTITVPGNTSYGVAYPDKTYTVAAGDEAWIPLRREYATDGRAAISYSAVTSVTVAVLQR